MIIKRRPGMVRTMSSVGDNSSSTNGLSKKFDYSLKEKTKNYVAQNKNDAYGMSKLFDAALDVYCVKGHVKDAWQSFEDEWKENEGSANLDRQDLAAKIIEQIVEQKIPGFDLFTMSLNKLELALGGGAEDSLEKAKQYLKAERSNLVKKELNEHNGDKNMKLLNWVNGLEFQAFDGEDYTSLDSVCKLICIAGDFIALTQGNWSLSDLFLLKTAMVNLEMNPKEKINVLEVAQVLTYNPPLVEKLLGEGMIVDGANQTFKDLNILALSYVGKSNCLEYDEGYVVDAIQNIMEANDIECDRDDIIDDITKKYIAKEYQMSLDKELESFELLVGLIYESKVYLDEME